ncbi:MULTISPECIES: TolB family protein [Falsihalocynthiibacter]|uniref:TolB family protein n=1 Tax=Falsihalocynthiibacter TaxID=2854182 RepID=UPI003001AB4D
MKSEIVIYNLATGSEEVILLLDQHLEAPNWTPDNAALIVNGEGRLYRVDLSAPALATIETGFATQINNDHGVSPDGTTLVMSDSTEEGSSVIYTLPITGGTPTRITPLAPSYWHGWSPDGATLAYTAKRGETFEIYTCPVHGGEERQVTFGFDHCDGPDYTTDGAWIWFNGERDARVCLWRVRPDGRDLECMVADDRVNWFPHPSPDGKSVLYLAYEGGTQGHPSERQVELRLVSAEGGRPQVLLELYGGQGTINVPCWAPDSQRFAFVRYHA